ncbi:hypothetical protein Y032_0011g1245 [Ancylostoma ceylanicum]|uniref:Transmembrane protein 144 n=2 Tax=Ancylostoma ceylanicum TaxID=53326 RepID=A0A016VCY8_9BILA|nr:hypothetical protein Y032_0011g1245 [Ancylostoma ceylanicum]
MWAGLLAAFVASIVFGSVFVPIKRVPCGDGFTVQLFMCLGAFITSAFVHGILDFPPVHGFAMIGGALWCSANAFAIQIMNRLGMALSILVWNTLSCLTGWATSRYGLFGLPSAIPASMALNYLGIIVLIAGGVMYLFVKNNPQESYDMDKLEKENYSMASRNEKNNEISSIERTASFLSAMFCGIFYGSMWIPVNYIKSHPNEFPDAPTDSTFYVFSFFCGVMYTSTFIFVIYCLVKRNRPWVNPEAAVPSMLGGAMLAVAMNAFVVSIDTLDQAVAYPICAMTPGLVTSLWSILYFREITGRQNLLRLATAYTFTLIGVALVTISKEVSVF